MRTKKRKEMQREKAAENFAIYKAKVKALVENGEISEAREVVRRAKRAYLRDSSYPNKKAYDGAKSGFATPKTKRRITEKTSRRRARQYKDKNYAEDPIKFIKDYEINKDIILADRDKDPLFTVALPIFNSKKIAWIAFESLARQVGVNFSWELVIAEELGPEQIGDALSEEYLEALKSVGCSRIVFLGLREWMPLFQKWMLIYQHSSIDTSKVFMLQAADCFSQIHRLRETMDIFEAENSDWVQTKKGYFYNVQTDSLALYDHSTLLFHKSRNMRSHPCCLNMAVKHKLMSLLKEVYCKRGVDGRIFAQIKQKKGSMKVSLNNSDSYLTGLDTDGYNNLSLGRKSKIVDIQVPFVPPEHNLSQILPEDIIKRLKKLRNEG